MIYLIGGTHDGRKIAQWLNEIDAPYFMSVATELGRSTYQDVAKHLVVARLNEAEMGELVLAKGVDWVIDASHPHAIEVSQTAINTCKTHHIRYTRWLREEIVFESDRVTLFDHFEEAFKALAQMTGRVLVTGSKELEKAAVYIDKTRIVARIVPNGESIAICEKLGLDAGQVIGLKGPFTEEMNQLIFKEWQIAHIVFKESGVGSGFEEKIQAAVACGVNPVVVRMPRLSYPECTQTLEALEFIYTQVKSIGGVVADETNH